MKAELSPRRRGLPEGDDRDEIVRPEWDESFEAVDPRKWGAPSPYLEERLSVARSAVADLVFRSQGVGREIDGLRRALDTIDREVDRASSELSFLRSSAAGVDDEPASWRVPTSPALPPLHSAIAREDSTPIPHRTPLPDRSLAASGPFEEFTLDRYNRTVGALHSRRRALGWGTVAAAAIISGFLLYLTLQAREPIPPAWLALLPLVWMVPVPFFLAAFRGTQRVLSHNRLELPEET